MATAPFSKIILTTPEDYRQEVETGSVELNALYGIKKEQIDGVIGIVIDHPITTQAEADTFPAPSLIFRYNPLAPLQLT